MGREEGGGFRMGSTGIPVADSFRCLAKLIQYCKVLKKKVFILNSHLRSGCLYNQTLIWAFALVLKHTYYHM